MSIATEIQRLQNAKANIKTAIENKGVIVDDATIDTYAEKISNIAGGDNWYNVFWDAFQDNGTKVVYYNSFYGSQWDDITFKPKYDMQPTNAINMFYGCYITDLKGICEKQGITLDFSKATQANNALADGKITNVGVVDLSGALSADQVFYRSNKLENVDLMVVLATHTFNNCFSSCTSLKEIRFSGEIGNNISFANSSLLSNDSIQSIIDCLADLTENVAKTLTLNSTVGDQLTDEQKVVITAKNWTLVY